MLGVLYLGLFNKGSHKALLLLFTLLSVVLSPPLTVSYLHYIFCLPSLSFVHSVCLFVETVTPIPSCFSLVSSFCSLKADNGYCKFAPCWPSTSYPNYLLKSHPTIPSFLHTLLPYLLTPCSSFLPPSGYPTPSSRFVCTTRTHESTHAKSYFVHAGGSIPICVMSFCKLN